MPDAAADSQPSRPMPDFLVIGAARAGTTALFELLRQHPEVYLPPEKELHYFCRHYDRGADWYAGHFADATPGQRIGEASTTYTQQAAWPDAPARIAADLPNARLLYIVRHPLEQLRSFYQQCRRLSHYGVVGAFNASVRDCPVLLDTCRYARQLSHYAAYADAGQLKVLFHEDLRRDWRAVVREAFEFLGADPDADVLPAEEATNTAVGAGMDTALTRGLRRAGVIRFAARLLPAPLVRRVGGVLKPSIVGKPAWDPATRRWVCGQIEDESRDFLARHGKPRDFWRFEPDEQ